MKRVVMVTAIVLAAMPARADGEKSGDTAKLLSGGGAALASALVVGSFMFADQGKPFNLPLLYTGLGASIVAPSLGEWYAGEWLTIGMGVRIAASGLATYAVTSQQQTVACDGGAPPLLVCKNLKGTGVALLGVAAIAWIGGIAYDVGDASSAVERYQRRNGVFVSPTVMPGPTGLAPGVMAGGGF